MVADISRLPGAEMASGSFFLLESRLQNDAKNTQLIRVI
jgi:hypothetical protein